MCKKLSKENIMLQIIQELLVMKLVIIFNLLMLEMEYYGLFCQNHTYWCPGFLSHQGIRRNGIVNI